MSNNLPTTVDQLVGAISRTTTLISTSGGGEQYLKLAKSGFFIFGVDDLDVEDGSRWAVNPNSFMLGYVAWKSEGGGKPLGEEMRSIFGDPIAESTLPPVAGSWTQQVGMQLV